MKLRVEVDGDEYLLEWNPSPADGEVCYSLAGSARREGKASVVEGVAGTYSVLLGENSFPVSVIAEGGEYVAELAGRRYRVTLTDARDRSAKLKKQTVSGPVELLAHMPGRVIKFLVQSGASVKSGESLVVVEAMKMQNEVKAPKDGVVSKVFATEGATVAAGEPLLRLD